MTKPNRLCFVKGRPQPFCPPPMTPREQLKRKIIEAIHNLPYEDALLKEIKADGINLEAFKKSSQRKILEQNKGLPCTIGRVLQALKDKKVSLSPTGNIFDISCMCQKLVCQWQLTKNGVELTDDDQTDETISALLKLFNS